MLEMFFKHWLSFYATYRAGRQSMIDEIILLSDKLNKDKQAK